MIYFEEIEAPFGTISIEATETKLTGLRFSSLKTKANPNEITKECIRQLREYFAGDRKDFDLPIELEQGTYFQNTVWKSLLSIPYGKTSTYAEQAKMIKNPKAQRAVGSANGKNPISIIIPCHRIIGKDGNLTGFGGGIEIKRWLLNHELKNS